MGALLLLGTTASSTIAETTRDPYAWTMSCERWEERAREILKDESLGTEQQRYWLVSHLRTKVQGECSHPFDLLQP